MTLWKLKLTKFIDTYPAKIRQCITRNQTTEWGRICPHRKENKMEWKSININTNLIKADTEKAVLIKMPHNSNYNGFCFWHSGKLVREGTSPHMMSLSYTEEFIFHLKKYGRGKYNRQEVLEQTDIGAEEFEEAFAVIPQKLNPYETHKPADIEAVRVEALEELKDV